MFTLSNCKSNKLHKFAENKRKHFTFDCLYCIKAIYLNELYFYQAYLLYLFSSSKENKKSINFLLKSIKTVQDSRKTNECRNRFDCIV